MEMKLTKNFTLNEMCKSITARKRKIKNVPSFGDIKRLKALCENVLQPLRDYLGEPVIINSGYRSPELNRIIGGVNGSQHLKGEAADINCRGSLEYARNIIQFIMINCEFDQLILERKKTAIWVHVSYSKGQNRQQVLNLNK